MIPSIIEKKIHDLLDSVPEIPTSNCSVALRVRGLVELNRVRQARNEQLQTKNDRQADAFRELLRALEPLFPGTVASDDVYEALEHLRGVIAKAKQSNESVQRAQEFQTRNERQAETIKAMRIQRADFADVTHAVAQEVRTAEANLSRLMGKGIQFSPELSLAQQVKTMGSNLVTAFTANRELARNDSRSLAEQNQGLHTTLHVFRTSVDRAHAFLDEKGVARSGDVTTRIKHLLGTNGNQTEGIKKLQGENAQLRSENQDGRRDPYGIYKASVRVAHSFLDELGIPRKGDVVCRMRALFTPIQQQVDRAVGRSNSSLAEKVHGIVDEALRSRTPQIEFQEWKAKVERLELWLGEERVQKVEAQNTSRKLREDLDQAMPELRRYRKALTSTWESLRLAHGYVGSQKEIQNTVQDLVVFNNRTYSLLQVAKGILQDAPTSLVFKSFRVRSQVLLSHISALGL